MGHAQLAGDALLLGAHRLQTAQVGHGAIDDEAQQEQAKQMKQGVAQHCPLLVFIELGGHLRQLAQRHVGREHGHRLAVGIVDGQRVAAHQHVAVLALVGFAPVAVAAERTLVPRPLGIVDIVCRFLQAHVLAFTHLIDVEPEERTVSMFRSDAAMDISGLEADRNADDLLLAEH